MGNLTHYQMVNTTYINQFYPKTLSFNTGLIFFAHELMMYDLSTQTT